jgi:hypothetical protein
MNIKPCCSTHSLHLMFYYTQHNVHQSVILMTSTTAYIYFYETWCTALVFFSENAHWNGWSMSLFPNGWTTTIILRIQCNPHIRKGYRLQTVNHREGNSITTKIISKKCTYKELLCASAYPVRKRIEALLLYCFVSCTFFLSNIQISYKNKVHLNIKMNLAP